MKFMLLIVEPRGQRDTRSEDEGRALYAEMVGGFYLIECANRDEAVRIAENCPAARFATVEVRECAPCYVN